MSTEIIVALFENSCWLLGTWNESMCTHAYMITKWFPTQWTAAAVCLEFSIALVNSYEDIMDQEHFVPRYESFSCYNHSEYLSHYWDILVEEKKKEQQK